MTTELAEAPTFNALTSGWLPLIDEEGAVRWASPIDVLCGDADGIDLDYPRDDFRVYARLLLSALVQALMPANNAEELAERIRVPLKRAEVERRVSAVVDDFYLFGSKPFLQVVRPDVPKDGGAARFVFPTEDLYRAQVAVDAISLPIALVTLFAEQTYAGGAGRGYAAGPGGQPGAFTLIDAGTVRTTAWANTLSLDCARRTYAAEDPVPWSGAKRSATPRAAVGLVTGLFFQPRGTWLEPIGHGRCSFTGMDGPVAKRGPLLAKSELASKVSGVEDLWPHPCAPLAVNSQGIAPVRLAARRPAWTGLAQLLRPLSKAKGKKKHPSEGPAPVLAQWKSLPRSRLSPRLIVLDFDRDKANIRKRFYESYPLSEHLLGDGDAVEALRAVAEHAQDVLHILKRALTSAHDARKHGGFSMADVETAYWAASEAQFHSWLSVLVSISAWDDAADARLAEARSAMDVQLKRDASRIFDSHVALSEFDPAKQARVATARRDLLRQLYAGQGAARNHAPKSIEVNP